LARLWILLQRVFRANSRPCGPFRSCKSWNGQLLSKVFHRPPRRKHRFWRRNDPAAKFDIAKLRPKTLPRGNRFESLNDARRESARSEELLDAYRRKNGLSVFLKECRGGHYHCEKPCCPQCARRFRRWLIAEFLRLNSSFREPVTTFTVLLEVSAVSHLLLPILLSSESQP